MGASASTSNGGPAPGKPLESWSSEEVKLWFATLGSDITQHSGVILPATGASVSEWTQAVLVGKGLPPHTALLLLGLRDAAAEKASAPPSGCFGGRAASSASAGANPAGVPANGGGAAGPGGAGGAPPGGAGGSGGSGGNGGAAPVNTSGRDRAKAILAAAIPKAQLLVSQLGEKLPPPGSAAAGLVGMVLDLMQGAITNHDNLLALQKRIVGYVEMLAAYSKVLETLKYRQSVTSFEELLQRILVYVRQYRGRNVIIRMLTSSGDNETYLGFIDELNELIRDVTAGASLDANARLLEIKQLMTTRPAYVDPSAGARSLVEQLGGMEAVARDPKLLQQVVAKLDVGDRATIAVMSSLFESYLDKGPQRLIGQPDLRLFWKEFYAGVLDISWQEWWAVFPDRLKDVHSDASLVEQLQALLASDTSRTAFKRAVDQGAPDERVGAWELSKAFSGDDDLLTQVKQMVGDQSKKPGALRAAKAGVERCQLPELSDHYGGRDAAAAKVVEMVTRGSAVVRDEQVMTFHAAVLVGEGGSGKSSLAADAGWRLVDAGKVPGGALWVDLRGALTSFAIEARMCEALGVPLDVDETPDRIIAAARALGRAPDAGADVLASAGSGSKAGGALLVLDNVEDVLQSDEAAQWFYGMVNKLLAAAPSLYLLATTRPVGRFGERSTHGSPRPATSSGSHSGSAHAALSAAATTSFLQLPRFYLTGLDDETARAMVLMSDPKMDPHLATRVVAACGGVPLLVCLVGEGLVAGRLAVDDVCKAGPNMVRTVVSGLKPEQQRAIALLSVFPGAFDVEGASDVLGMPEFQTRGMLNVLHMLKLLTAAPSQQCAMQQLIREHGLQLASEAGLKARSEGRFVTHVLRHLNDWAGMYLDKGSNWKLALAMAWDQGPNINRLLQLLRQGPCAYDGLCSKMAAMIGTGHHEDGAWSDAEVASYFTPRLVALLRAMGAVGRWKAAVGAVLSRLSPGTNLLSPQSSAAAGRSGAAAAPVQFKLPGGGGGAWGRQKAAAAAALWMWAELQAATDNYAEATDAAQQCWHMRCGSLGPEHPDTITALRTMGAVAFYSGRELDPRSCGWERAVQVGGGGGGGGAGGAAAEAAAACYTDSEQLLDEVLEQQRRYLPEEDTEVAATLYLTARCVQAQSCQADAAIGAVHSTSKRAALLQAAEGLYRRALESRRKVLGEEHPDTTNTWEELARCLLAQGGPKKLRQAEAMCLWVLGARQRASGSNHPLTVAATDHLAKCMALGAAARSGRPALHPPVFHGTPAGEPNGGEVGARGGDGLALPAIKLAVAGHEGGEQHHALSPRSSKAHTIVAPYSPRASSRYAAELGGRPAGLDSPTHGRGR